MIFTSSAPTPLVAAGLETAGAVLEAAGAVFEAAGVVPDALAFPDEEAAVGVPEVDPEPELAPVGAALPEDETAAQMVLWRVCAAIKSAGVQLA